MKGCQFIATWILSVFRHFCVLTCLVVMSSVAAGASDIRFDDLFSAEQTVGTLIVESVGTGEVWLHDADRASEPKTPASTFKIPNSLFALEARVVADVDEVVPWDGRVRRNRDWNKPHSLRSAIIVSSVPTYQELARRIGRKTMGHLVNKAGYGNQSIGEAVDTFWLMGPLKISAAGQVAFLKRLHARNLPFSAQNQAAIIDILEVDRGDNWVLRAKSGWAVNTRPSIGWYVGWLELERDTYVFALNMDMLNSSAHLHARSSIARKALERITGVTLR